MTNQGPWSILPENRGQEYRFSAATAAIYCVLTLLVDLGYTIGITKSVLYPTTSVEYLGLMVDSVKQAFIVPGRKIEALAVPRKNILGCKKYTNVKTLQRFQGKCISLSLDVPAAKLFIREMSHAIASANDNGRVSLTPALREELSYWQFLDSLQDFYHGGTKNMFVSLCTLMLLDSDGGVSFTSQVAVSPAVITGMTRRGFSTS